MFPNMERFVFGQHLFSMQKFLSAFIPLKIEDINEMHYIPGIEFWSIQNRCGQHVP